VNVAERLWALVGAGHLPSTSRRKLGIVAFLYFLEGSPPAILWEVLPVYLRMGGASLAAIGGLRLLELPYSLKFFWSPLVHRYGDRRVWMCACLTIAAAAIVWIPFVEIAEPGWAFFGLVLVLVAASATQDVAIDSYTVGLVDPEELGVANGVRASAYRVALVLMGGVLLVFTPLLKWPGLFVTSAVLLVGLGMAALLVPRLDLSSQARRAWGAGFLTWVGTWRVVPLILFVLSYKLGEFAIGPMIKPFWVDQGRSLFEIGLVPTSIGIGLSVAGALTGGGFIARFGIFRGVWVLGLLQAASNLGYAVVAWGNLGRLGLYGASVFESYTGGLGTAAFLALLMNVCEKEHATVQYAFLSSLFALTGRLAGAVSGLGAERWGYGDYFAVTFLLSLPSLALLPWLKPWIRETPAS
jgi:MFS transporter, PAT family, beta-lactamase induction signal transducer AmpG